MRATIDCALCCLLFIFIDIRENEITFLRNFFGVFVLILEWFCKMHALERRGVDAQPRRGSDILCVRIRTPNHHPTPFIYRFRQGSD